MPLLTQSPSPCDPASRCPSLEPAVGLSIFVVALIVFGVIAGQVVRGMPITLLDAHIAYWLHKQATPSLTAAMLVFTNLHGVSAMSWWAIVFGLYLAYRKARCWLMVASIAIAGGMVLNVALKHAFQRARPSFEEPLLTLSTYSFPSGHTAGSTIFYGVLAAYLCSRTTSNTGRLFIVSTTVALILIVGLSRMYLGVHYFTDVIAAIAEGCAWLALVLTVVSRLRRRMCPRP